MMRSLLLSTVGALLFVTAACSGDRPAQHGPDGGGDTGTGGETFACGSTVRCHMDTEYCFAEMWNGATKVAHQCRALPTGCSSCACAESDAAPASMACTGVGTSNTSLTCLDGTGGLTDAATSRTLTILCQVP